MDQINIFLGGGVRLLEGDKNFVGYRNLVLDPIISKLNAKYESKGIILILKTFEDLTHYLLKEEKQSVYNKFIREDAQLAYFILDGSIGDKTESEIDNAYESYLKTGFPLIYVYGTNLTEDSSLVKCLNDKSQYYRHFDDIDNLKNKIIEDLQEFLLNKLLSQTIFDDSKQLRTKRIKDSKKNHLKSVINRLNNKWWRISGLAIVVFVVTFILIFQKYEKNKCDDDIVLQSHKFVDLNLPSGTLWATCNVGANNPEDRGLYFAWGEIVGSDMRKINIDWDPYKYYNSINNTMTKYCIDGIYGDVDNKQILEASDDAATANWGDNWRMPTKEEFNELVDSSYTTIKVKIINHKYGLLITSKANNKSIFLPTIIRNSSYFVGKYWSASVERRSRFSSTLNFYYFTFDTVHVSILPLYRCSQILVRPVRNK